jgi:F0F1-type ATP synthase membrane subunit a
MEHELSTITILLNSLVGGITGHEAHLPDQGVVAWFIVVVSAAIFIPLSRKFSVDNPGKAQQLLEIGVESINAMLDGFIGPNGRKYFPAMAGFAFFILATSTPPLRSA